MRAQIAATTANVEVAANAASRAVKAAKAVDGLDPSLDKFNLAKSYRVFGDIRRSGGDSDGAAAAWNAGLNAIPKVAAERPLEAQEHAELLERLGRAKDAAPLRQQLARAGYRYPVMRIGSRRTA